MDLEPPHCRDGSITSRPYQNNVPLLQTLSVVVVGDDDGEHVAEHGGVGLPVLRLGSARGPGDVEDVGNNVGEWRQGVGDGGGVGEIDVYVCQRGG